MIALAPAHLTGIKADLAKSTVRLTFDIMLTPEVLRNQNSLADFANGNVPLYLTIARNGGQLSLLDWTAGGSARREYSARADEGIVQQAQRLDHEDEDMAVLPQRAAAGISDEAGDLAE